MDLARLFELQRARHLDALAAVDAGHGLALEREAHAVVSLHPAVELGRVADHQEVDARRDGSDRGREYRCGRRSGHTTKVAQAGRPELVHSWRLQECPSGTWPGDRTFAVMTNRQDTQRIALVTGANKGIGHETARRLAAAGMTVLVGARDRARGEAAVSRLRAATARQDVHLVLVDVADDESVSDAARRIESDFGRLDVLVNNAAIAA